jgi:putative membrane protein
MRHFRLFVTMTAITLLSGATLVNADPSAQDKQFIAAAGSGGMLEVRLGEYASNNAASDAIKKFGEHMVGDHTKLNDQLKTLATQQPIEIPRALNSDDQKVLDRLEKVQGTEFDKAYVTQMVEDHKKDIAAFQKEIDQGSDPSVKAFAEKALPTLQHHLKMAEELQNKG